jgi:DNA processing protein
MRNAIMSAYSHATVVIQAGEHSGARAQARIAVEHGRPVILVDQVVTATEWGKRLQNRPGISVASSLAPRTTMEHIRAALAREHDIDTLGGVKRS